MSAPRPQIVLFKPEWLLNLALGAAVLYVLYRVRATLVILALGYLIYKLLDPLANLIQKRIKSRGLAVLLVFVLILLALGLMLNLVLPSLIRDIAGLIQNYDQIQKNITGFVDQKVLTQSFLQSPLFKDNLHQALQWLSGQLLNFGQQVLGAGGLVVSGVSQVLLGTIIALYLLLDKTGIQTGLQKLLPAQKKKDVLKTFKIINAALMNYLRGMFLLSGIMFALVWLILTLLKVPYAIAFAFWWGLMEFLPMIGSTLAIIPPLLLVLMIHTQQFWLVLAVLIVLQVIEGNVLVPRIMNRSTGLHPLLIVVALLAGNNLAGILGMIVAVPVTTMAVSILKEFKKL